MFSWLQKAAACCSLQKPQKSFPPCSSGFHLSDSSPGGTDIGPDKAQKPLPASAILWSCDSPSIYRSSVTEQQLRIGLIMKSLLCLTVKVGLNCKSLLSSNLLWVVLISESSALRIWYCCTYSILSFLMQIKYYNPVLTYCQCCAWYYKLSHLAV